MEAVKEGSVHVFGCPVQQSDYGQAMLYAERLKVGGVVLAVVRVVLLLLFAVCVLLLFQLLLNFLALTIGDVLKSKKEKFSVTKKKKKKKEITITFIKK